MMTLLEKTLYLIDGSGYIYRAYHALGHLSTSQGLPTNATYGFANMLLKLLADREPEYMVMAFDARGPTFRHELYEAYKANRPAMPEDLAVQLPYIRQIVEAMNIPVLEAAGYEADDVIGTLSRQAQEAGFRVIMVTGDKDFRQLISTTASIWDPMRDRTLDLETIRKEYGIEPSQWVDVMALCGDTSDNIPGVPGVGEKTGVKLIKEFGTVVNLYQNLDKVSGKKLKESLAGARERMELSRRLVTIDTCVPLSETPSSFRVPEPDSKRLTQLFKALEFRRLLHFFQTKADLSSKRYESVQDEKALTALIEDLRQSGRFAVDVETTSINPMAAVIVGLSFAYQPHQGFYIPLRHRQGDQLDAEETLRRLKPLLEDARLAKIGQNIKYDWVVLRHAGIDLKGVAFDTMVASYLLDPTRRGHNLETIAAEYLDHKKLTYKEVVGGKGDAGFDTVPIDKGVAYSCEDADITLMACEVLKPKLEEGGFKSLFEEVEMPLLAVLVDMEMTGFCVDKSRLRDLSKEFERQLGLIEERIYAVAGEHFNIQSHQQLGCILFKKLKLPIQKKTKKGMAQSTDVRVLTALANEHELPALVLQYRTVAKLKSTYADALLNLINPETGRIHTSFNQTITATGRLSSSDPNLQNIPIRTEEGRKIRAAFVPREGWVMLSADYSQIELRLLAHLADDPILIGAFREGLDIHTQTAAEIFQLFPSMVTPEMRRQAKVINFGIIYGMGPFRLSNELGISQKMAKTYIDNYFLRYQGVRQFIDKTVEEARIEGKVATLLGRHRYLPDILSSNRVAREAAERTAVNTPIQGTAADLIKVAMIRIHRALDEKAFRAKMLLQVHDELVFEVPPGELDGVKSLVRDIMEGVYDLKVPLRVEIGVGKNWAEVH